MRGQQCIRPRCRRMQDSADYCRHHRNMLRATGQAGLFDSAMAKQHILFLTGRGASLHWVARESGVAFSTVWRIVAGETTRARATTLRALMAVGADRARSDSVSSSGARRRVQALIRIGWTYPMLTARTGLGQTTLRKVIYRERISRGLADRVVKVYAELENTPGPSRRAAAVAASKGFAPPSAWDDETIDDPRARPNVTGYDEDIVRALMRGDAVDSRQVDRREAVARLSEQGMGLKAIAALIRVSDSTVGLYKREAA